jgi:hypothetical protein
MSARSLSVSALAESPPPWPVDALVVGERPADLHAALDALAAHGLHAEHDLTVGKQQHVAGGHVRRQVLVGNPDRVLVAFISAEGRIQGE